jgi:hypothetical protein
VNNVYGVNAHRADHAYLPAKFSSGKARRVWMKFVIDIMSLGSTLKLCFSISYNRYIDITDVRTCEVGSTLEPRTAEAYNDVLLEVFGKTQNFYSKFLYDIKYQHGVCTKQKKKDLDPCERSQNPRTGLVCIIL